MPLPFALYTAVNFFQKFLCLCKISCMGYKAELWSNSVFYAAIWNMKTNPRLFFSKHSIQCNVQTTQKEEPYFFWPWLLLFLNDSSRLNFAVSATFNQHLYCLALYYECLFIWLTNPISFPLQHWNVFLNGGKLVPCRFQFKRKGQFLSVHDW